MVAVFAIQSFDGSALWTGLSAHEQLRIGAAALELAAAWLGQDKASDPQSARLYIAAEDAARRSIENFGFDILRSKFPRFDPTPVPSLLGDFCRVCHCSHFDPCPGGCGWEKPGLCTACADAAPPAEAEEVHHD